MIEAFKDIKHGGSSYNNIGLERTASQILHHIEDKDSEDSIDSCRRRVLCNPLTIPQLKPSSPHNFASLPPPQPLKPPKLTPTSKRPRRLWLLPPPRYHHFRRNLFPQHQRRNRRTPLLWPHLRALCQRQGVLARRGYRAPPRHH